MDNSLLTVDLWPGVLSEGAAKQLWIGARNDEEFHAKFQYRRWEGICRRRYLKNEANDLDCQNCKSAGRSRRMNENTHKERNTSHK
jgi:hypothetical protein